MQAEGRTVPRAWEGLAIALLALVSLGLYARGLDHDFVGFDDRDYVKTNIHVRRGIEAAGVRWAFTTVHASNWHPLTWISHMVDCELFGLWAGGHHLVSALLHAANAVLLYLFLRLATRAFWPSVVVAALFAWHPLRVESVAWVSERKDVLSGFFWMTTLLAYLAYARRRSAGRYAVVALSFALGLMAKPMVVTLPFVLLLLDAWPLGRWKPGERSRCVLEKLPLLALAAASSLVTMRAQAGAMSDLERIPLAARLENASISTVAYLGKAVWPARLAVYYPHPSVVDPGASHRGEALAAGLFLLVVTAAVLLVRKRRDLAPLPVGWFWYLGTLVPVVGLVQVGRQAMADRYTYLPLIGIAIAAVFGAAEAVRGRPRARRAAAAVTCSVLALACLATWRQVGTWRDSESVFRQALRVSGETAMARRGLGLVYFERGELDAAREELERARRLSPQGARILQSLGMVEIRAENPAAARVWIERALEQQPDMAGLHYDLGLVLAALGDVDGAVASYERALELDPEIVEAWVNLGDIHLRRGDVPAARAALERALELDPELPDAHHNLALVAEREGDLPAAVRHLRRALELDPELLPSASALAWMLATSRDPTVRDGAEALRWAEVAARATDHRDPRQLSVLAAACAEAGRFDEAVRRQREAIELVSGPRRKAMEARLELYRNGKPFRQP